MPHWDSSTDRDGKVWFGLVLYRLAVVHLGTWQTGFAHEPDLMFRFRFMIMAGLKMYWGLGSTPCMNLNLKFEPEPEV